MAPKRAKIVRTTKKVVEETVEVLGVAVDSHNSVDLPAASDSKIVEVVVEAKEDEVPISVVVVAKDKKTEPETEQKQRAEEAYLETEEPPQQKGDENDRSKKKEAAESIADMETQEGEEGGDEQEEKGEEDERVEKEAEPPTPKKVEQRKETPVKESKKGGKRKRRRLGGGEMDGVGGGYKRYVFRVLKQVHPGLGISTRAMAVGGCLMGDMFERLANEAARLLTYSGKATLSSREVQGTVQLVLPGELGKHAIYEGSKAVANYMAAASGGGD